MSKINSNMLFLRDKEKSLCLRKSLFWDMSGNRLDLRKNKQLIIERVITRGNIDEFKQLVNYYSDNDIRNSVVRIGTLDKKTLNLISKIYSINPEKFKCYSGKQSEKTY